MVVRGYSGSKAGLSLILVQGIAPPCRLITIAMAFFLILRGINGILTVYGRYLSLSSRGRRVRAGAHRRITSPIKSRSLFQRFDIK